MLEATGQKPTKPSNVRNGEYVFEEGKWWYAGTKSKQGKTERQTLESHERKNKTRMFVDGKYVPKSHPLHKPGRYTGFTEAAFSSLQNYDKAKQGQVYVIRNPAFPSWCKVGMAIDAEDRLKQYQTSSPYRDYVLVASWDVEDRREAEKQAHALLEQHYERRGEWFVAYSDMAAERLEAFFNKNSDDEKQNS